MNTPKIMKKKTEKEVLYVVCQRCKKVIEGSKESEVLHNFRVHDESCSKK